MDRVDAKLIHEAGQEAVIITLQQQREQIKKLESEQVKLNIPKKAKRLEQEIVEIAGTRINIIIKGPSDE